MNIQASPITWKDQLSVNGNFFVFRSNPSERFYIKGIAFPVAPGVNAEDIILGWIDILHQLREASPEINTIRIYQIWPSLDYSEFLQAAADMGFYLIVPLTSMNGRGVLSREKAAPKCYRRKLFNYGSSVIRDFGKFPNILGYVLGNEVMNSLESWETAPCILAYARDLKREYPEVTLMYAMQHAGIGAAGEPSEAVKLTLDYMSECPEASIDALGVNIESWCSSKQTFDHNPDGSIGTYKELYQHLNHSKIPLFFSELGCSKDDFNRDNELEKGYRDWKQVHSILGSDMIDRWSGFVAYAYDGPLDFKMTLGGRWDGNNTLEFSKDMENYVNELDALDIKYEYHGVSNHTSGTNTTHSITDFCPDSSPASAALSSCCDIDLLPVSKIPSYQSWSPATTSLLVLKCLAFLCLCFGIKSIFSKKVPNEKQPSSELDPDDAQKLLSSKNSEYQTFQQQT
ncbi:unnamed protein product [Cylindrotheca closterium]|uniref:Uncharacterized protein n=1 Tax=Cylindrotheca closterium TaxID=2856 RepID=A0AAD2G1I9_9STRA|nr:unnamed protein product [Cylindrotheca closterium]